MNKIAFLEGYMSKEALRVPMSYEMMQKLLGKNKKALLKKPLRRAMPRAQLRAAVRKVSGKRLYEPIAPLTERAKKLPIAPLTERAKKLPIAPAGRAGLSTSVFM